MKNFCTQHGVQIKYKYIFYKHALFWLSLSLKKEQPHHHLHCLINKYDHYMHRCTLAALTIKMTLTVNSNDLADYLDACSEVWLLPLQFLRRCN